MLEVSTHLAVLIYGIQTRTNVANCKLPESPIFEKISRIGQISFTMVNSMSMAHSAIFSLVRRMTNIAMMIYSETRLFISCPKHPKVSAL